MLLYYCILLFLKVVFEKYYDSYWGMQNYFVSYFSKKVTFLNVFLTFVIVVLHAKTPERWGIPLDMNNPFIYMVYVFTQIGVPMFFFISGLLFYRNCKFDDVERKLKSRVYSLLIPYVLWNTLFVGVFFILTHIPFIHNKMNMGDVLNDPLEIIHAILNARYTVLWFVKDLMIFCCLSAGIYLALKNKVIALSVLILSVINTLFENYGYENIFTWFPMYFSGAIIGKFYLGLSGINEGISGIMKNRFHKISVSLLLIIIFVFLYSLSVKNEDFLFCYRFFSPIILWFLTDLLLIDFLEKKFHVKHWMSYMFFIFCTHQFFLNMLQKIVVLNFPPTTLVLNVTFVITPVIVFLILIQIARVLSRYKFYTYLSGGR